MKTVTVAELKSHLSRELRATQQGSEVVVTSHGHPIAKLIPYNGDKPLSIRRPTLPVSALHNISGVRPLRPVDPVALVREDRDAR